MARYVKVAKLSDIPAESARCVEVEGKRIGLFNLGGIVHAIDDTCPHAEASLSEGDISGTEVVCPLHYATFDLETGACTGPPADEDVATYAVRVEGDDIEIDLGREQCENARGVAGSDAPFCSEPARCCPGASLGLRPAPSARHARS